MGQFKSTVKTINIVGYNIGYFLNNVTYAHKYR